MCLDNYQHYEPETNWHTSKDWCQSYIIKSPYKQCLSIEEIEDLEKEEEKETEKEIHGEKEIKREEETNKEQETNKEKETKGEREENKEKEINKKEEQLSLVPIKLLNNFRYAMNKIKKKNYFFLFYSSRI